MATKNTTTNYAARKTSCPMSRTAFKAAAKDLATNLGGQPMVATVKEFSTGSFGWYGNGKITVLVDGVAIPCQVSLNITAIGSKDLPAAGSKDEQTLTAKDVGTVPASIVAPPSQPTPAVPGK